MQLGDNQPSDVQGGGTRYRDMLVHAFACMGTVVTFRIVGNANSSTEQHARSEAVTRATEWFRQIELSCNRFDSSSEVRKLSQHVGRPMRVSALLFQSVQFALAVAEETSGAFDPSIGLRMEALGFDRDYRTGKSSGTNTDLLTDLKHSQAAHAEPRRRGDNERRAATFRDIELDEASQSITLHAPLLLDLGAVAKGLAIDVAAREFQPFENFLVDAGGDVYVQGHNEHNELWRIGIRHPRIADKLLQTLHVSNTAVCTSGDYERRVEATAEGHVVDARNGMPIHSIASITVLASSAMVADTLGTAAFSLGVHEGLALLERHGVDGLIVTPSIERFTTTHFPTEHTAVG